MLIHIGRARVGGGWLCALDGWKGYIDAPNDLNCLDKASFTPSFLRLSLPPCSLKWTRTLGDTIDPNAQIKTIFSESKLGKPSCVCETILNLSDDGRKQKEKPADICMERREHSRILIWDRTQVAVVSPFLQHYGTFHIKPWLSVNKASGERYSGISFGRPPKICDQSGHLQGAFLAKEV